MFSVAIASACGAAQALAGRFSSTSLDTLMNEAKHKLWILLDWVSGAMS